MNLNKEVTQKNEIKSLKKQIVILQNEIKELKKCKNCNDTKKEYGYYLCYDCYEMVFPLSDLS
jgi:hypothetical protein